MLASPHLQSLPAQIQRPCVDADTSWYRSQVNSDFVDNVAKGENAMLDGPNGQFARAALCALYCA